jgi:hypothetical protein
MKRLIKFLMFWRKEKQGVYHVVDSVSQPKDVNQMSFDVGGGKIGTIDLHQMSVALGDDEEWNKYLPMVGDLQTVKKILDDLAIRGVIPPMIAQVYRDFNNAVSKVVSRFRKHANLAPHAEGGLSDGQVFDVIGSFMGRCAAISERYSFLCLLSARPALLQADSQTTNSLPSTSPDTKSGD